MKRTSRCIFSILLLTLLSTAASAQKAKKDSAAQKEKEVTILVPAGIRIGADLSRIAVKIFQPYRTDVTVNLDAQFKDRLYFASELSYNRTAHSDTATYSYKGSGMAATLGVNYNLLKRQVPKENFIIYGGARYGIAVFSYEIPEYVIDSDYWGLYKGSLPKTNEMAHWFELTVGIKAEVLKNFFLGWSLHERILLNKKLSTQDFPPLIIPGFGKGNKGNAFDMQYTVSYLVPLWKVRQVVKL
ncbi:DUF6048 family protein [Chitinophaga lutea]